MKVTNIKKLWIKFIGGGLIKFPHENLREVEIDGDGTEGGGGGEDTTDEISNMIKLLTFGAIKDYDVNTDTHGNKHITVNVPDTIPIVTLACSYPLPSYLNDYGNGFNMYIDQDDNMEITVGERQITVQELLNYEYINIGYFSSLGGYWFEDENADLLEWPIILKRSNSGAGFTGSSCELYIDMQGDTINDVVFRTEYNYCIKE